MSRMTRPMGKTPTTKTTKHPTHMAPPRYQHVTFNEARDYLLTHTHYGSPDELSTNGSMPTVTGSGIDYDNEWTLCNDDGEFFAFCHVDRDGRYVLLDGEREPIVVHGARRRPAALRICA